MSLLETNSALHNAPFDTIPYESSLQRLLRASVCSDDALSDYGLSQAYRSILWAVRDPVRPLRTQAASGGCSNAIAAMPMLALSSSQLDVKELRVQSTDGSVVQVKGSAAVLYTACLAALGSSSNLRCVTYVSMRMLVDGGADGLGVGNERPVCSEEWSEALASFGMNQEGNTSTEESQYIRLCEFNRRFQLGYFLLAAGTLRAIVGPGGSSTTRRPEKHLYTHFSSLCHLWVTRVLPRAAQLAEGKADRYSYSCSSVDGASDGTPFPSRLTVEANNFIIHSFHYLCADVLASQQSTTKLVLDRALPQELWSALTLVRNAIRRGLVWVNAEAHANVAAVVSRYAAAVAAGATSAMENGTTEVVHHNSNKETESFAREIAQMVDCVFVDLIKRQEKLQCARLAAVQKYGESSADCHQLDDLLWISTIRMCLCVKELTGAWACTQGGLGIASACAGLVLRRNADVVAYVATCVTQVAAVDSSDGPSEVDVFCATYALLSAALAVAAVAPLSKAQEQLWLSQPDMTRQVHGVLVQRALRYRDEGVLALASKLSNSILYSSGSYGGSDSGKSTSSTLSAFAADSSERLLELISEGRDAASRCVVEMLTTAIVERPHSLIPALFRILEHGDVGARRNVLDVLAGLPRLRRASGADEGVPSSTNCFRSDDRIREVLRTLATQLLTHLQDEELCVRMHSAPLFSKVWPEDVIKPLLNLCLQRDSTGRRQASAKAALLSIMESHAENAHVVLLLLQDAFDLFRTLSQSGKHGHTVREQQSDKEAKEAFSDERPARSMIPSTPGDVLEHALLFSTESFEEITTGAAEKDSVEAKDKTAGTVTAPSLSKTERLNSLVFSLCERWVVSVGDDWHGSQHVTPLLLFLKEIPHSQEEAQQWHIRAVTRILHLITQPLKEGSDAQYHHHHALVLRRSNRAALEGISSALLLNCIWTELPNTWERATTAEERTGIVYEILLPLLCLRSCSRNTFASYTGVVESSTSEASDDIALVKAIWDCVWTEGLLRQEHSAFYSRHRDIQRVLLEVVNRFRMRLVFSALCAEKVKRAGGQQDDATLSQVVNQDLFLARVAVFTVCARLASSPRAFCPLDKATTEATEVEDDDVSVIVAEAPLPVVETVKLLVFPWLLQETDKTVTSGAAQEAELERLAMASTDAVALLSLVGIARKGEEGAKAWKDCAAVTFTPLQDLAAYYRATTGKPAHSATTVGTAEVATCCSTTGSLAVQETTDEHTRKYKDEAAAKEIATSNPEGLLVAFQFAMQVQRRTVEIVRTHLVSASLYNAWLCTLLPVLVELSNACCASPVGRDSHHSQVAVQCCDFLFHSVLLSRKLANTTSPSTAEADQPGPQVRIENALFQINNEGSKETATASVLYSLPTAEKEALVRFAVGSARYTSSVEVQKSGVRLLSCLLGAAPDLFVDLGSSTNSSDAMNANGLELFREATTALQSVALMHPDAQTRTLAEQVLEALFGSTEKRE